jgi:hypothetical protein
MTAFRPGIPSRASLALLASLAAILLAACLREPTQVAGGGWSDTETGQKVSGIIRREDGRPAVGALVQLRPSDYLGRSPATSDPFGVSASNGSVLDGTCDSTGRYTFDSVIVGQYALESRYQEINAVAVRFARPSAKGRLEMSPAYVKPVGSITGRVRFSDGVQGAVLVRIYGLERAVLADNSTGVYTFGNVPEGSYTLQFSSLEPFVQPMEKPGVKFSAGSGVNAGETVMIRGLRQPYTTGVDGYLEIPGVDSTNPVIQENGEFRSSVDGAYLWAKASMGKVNLRGTITSYARDTGEAVLRSNVANCRGWMDLARNSGMHLDAEPVAGARHKLIRPRSGNLEDIVPEATEGSLLLVEEARKATAAKPLVLICASNLTTAAQALLLDPSIADRMIVLGSNHGNLNNDDSLALAVVAKKGRFVEWARNYYWDSAYASLQSPALFFTNRFGEALRKQFGFWAGKPSWGYSSFGDFGAATFMYQRKVWRSAVSANQKYPSVDVETQVPAPYDFVDVPSASTDWLAIEAEFYATLTNPAVYHPWPLSAGFRAETYSNAFNVALDSNQAEQAEVGTWKIVGSWADYQVQADAAKEYALEIRYQADSTSRLRISDGASGASVLVDLPAGAAWTTAAAALPLTEGVHTLRVESLQGPFRLNWIHSR